MLASDMHLQEMLLTMKWSHTDLTPTPTYYTSIIHNQRDHSCNKRTHRATARLDGEVAETTASVSQTLQGEALVLGFRRGQVSQSRQTRLLQVVR